MTKRFALFFCACLFSILGNAQSLSLNLGSGTISNLDFGDTLVGIPKALTVELQNGETSDVDVTVSSGNSCFTISPTSATLGASGTETFTITFTPDTTANETDTLIFANSISNDTLVVTGTGYYQAATDAGSFLEFSSASATRIECGTSIDLANKSFSIDFWAKRSSTGMGSHNMIFGMGNQGVTDQELHIGFRNTNVFTFAFYSDDLNTTNTYTDTDWHHWACTYDYETKEQIIYCDGIPVGSRTTSETGFNTSGKTFKIGCSTLNANNFNGQLDEIRVWYKTLTQEEIRSQYGPLSGNEEGLAAYWRFDEGDGSYIYDATGNGNTGTLINSPTWITTSTAPMGTPTLSTTLSTSIDFGELTIPARDTLTYQVSNTGSGILNLDLAGLETPYYVSETALALFNGESADVNIIYVPDTSGSFVDTIQYEGNVELENTILQGSAIYQAAEDAGSAIDFDGSNDYIKCDANTDLDVSEGTIEFWINPAAAQTSTGAIISHRSGSTTHYSIHMNSDLSSIKFWNGSNVSTFSYSFTAGNWYHVAMVTNESGSELYVNGISVGTSSSVYGSGTNLPLYIGSSTGGKEYFTGQIDEIRIWNIALTRTEIRSQYTSLSGNEEGLAAYWRLDEGDGDYAYDVTGNENTGTLTNSSTWVNPSTAPIGTPKMTSNLPSSIDFGELPFAQGDIKTYQILNEGKGVLNLDFTGLDSLFSVSDSTIGVVSGDTASITIAYLPDTLGTFSDTLVYSGNVTGGSISMSATSVSTTYEDAGNALDFDADKSNYVSCNHIDLYNKSFSLDCWAKRGTTGVNDYILSLGESASYHVIHMGFTGNNNFRFGFGGDDLTTSTNYTDNNWHHWACTYDIDSKLMTIYCDGVSVSSRTANTGYSYSEDATLLIGTYLNNHYFTGQIDELRIWDKALTQTEIRSQYGPLTGNEDSLYAYWRFDESDGDYVYDATGNGKYGVFMNGTSREIPSTAPVADAELAILTDTISFSTSALGKNNEEEFALTNLGGGFVHLEDVFTDSSYIDVNLFDDIIASKDTLELQAIFTPSQTGEQSGYIFVETNVGKDSVFVTGTTIIPSFIQTIESIDTTKTTARISVSIDSIGSPNTGYGLCWSSEGAPTITDSIVDYGPALAKGVDTLTMSNLEPATTYSVKAYILNDDYVSYGIPLTITTYGAPVVTADSIMSITDSTANCALTITNVGNPALTSYGICWGTTTAPTLLDSLNQVDASASTGSYTLALDSLISETTYYVRAFAINSIDTVYSDTISFTASNAILSAVDTFSINVQLATTGDTTLTIYNTGAVAMDVHMVSTDGDLFTSRETTHHILAGESGEIAISYTAEDTNTVYSKLYITSTAGRDTIILKGTAYMAAADDAGNAIYFDGSNDYVNLGSPDALDQLPNGNFTIEMWINSTDNTTRSILVGNYPAGDCYNFELTSNGKLRTYLDGYNYYSGDVVADGTWHHIASVVDFDNDLVTMYIDGIVTSSGSFTRSTYTVSGYNTYIGRDPRSGSYYYKGQMDEVRFWDKALTQDEIRSHFNSIVGDNDNLVAYYRFDEENGNYAYDASGNGLTGTLYYSPTRVIPSTAPLGTSEFAFTADSLYVGLVKPGSTISANLEVANMSLGIVDIDSLKFTNSAFDMDTDSLAIVGEDTTAISVSFAPDTVGYYSDYVMVYYYDEVDSIKIYGYGSEDPEIGDIAVDTVTGTTATVSVNFEKTGCPTPNQYGLCWNKTGLTNVTDDHSDEGSLTTAGTYDLVATGLKPITTYHVRAYMINDNVVTYSDEITFATIKQTPVITWATPADITYSTALDSIQLNAVADLAGTITYSPDTGTVLDAGNSQELSVVFTPTSTDSVFVDTVKVNINVLKAALAVGVSVEDDSIVQGDDIPGITITYDGFVNDEDKSVLDTLPSATCEATTESDAGTYDIVVSGGSDNNYEMSYTNGTLTITPLSGIEDASLANISVYPNPVANIVTVTFNDITATISYKLVSVSGKVLAADVVNNGSASIDMSSCEAGVYFIQLLWDNQEFNYKIVKE